ncbi:MAG: hypothetical protein KGZ88_11890 [Methylomicrobium sp.]|nr:hypothetical protein [Methylomicrobium sp.]
MIKNRETLVVIEEITASLIDSAEQIESDSEFDNGRRIAYYEAVSTILSQCKIAGIDLESIGLKKDFSPEIILKKQRKAA